MREQLKEIKKELLKNLSELISTSFVLILMLVLAYIAVMGIVEEILQYIIIAAVGSAFMLLIGFEKRAKRFDKYVSLTVVFFLSLSFMFL